MMNLSIQNLRNKNLGILKFALEVVLMQQWIENGLICDVVWKNVSAKATEIKVTLEG